MGAYDDIIDLSRPVSKKHKPMDKEMRAVQFAPFAALVGYDKEIEETARYTDKKIELNEDEKAELDEKVGLLSGIMFDKPEITVVYFVKDKKKDGGVYLKKTGQIKKIDYMKKQLVFSDGVPISTDDVLSIDGEIFNVLDV